MSFLLIKSPDDGESGSARDVVNKGIQLYHYSTCESTLVVWELELNVS